MRTLYLVICFQFVTLLGIAGTVFANDLPACPSSGYFHNCFGTYAHDSNSKWSGDKYVGEFRDGKGNGQGTYYHERGDKYVGEFRDGKEHEGTYTFANGNKFVGEFRDGAFNGQGTFYYLADDEFKGDKYVGEWRDNKRNGQGTYYHASGNKYVGEWRDGKEHGQGTLYHASGNKYVGEFKDSMPNGQGTFYHASGAKYVGEWRDDKKNGQGTYTFADGDKYVGEFKDSMPNGQGTFYYLADDEFKGDKYVGEWRDSMPNGQGTFTHADGNKFVGEFRDGAFNGQGTFYYLADDEFKGDKYVGEWRDNKRNGQGTHYIASGGKFVGEFRDDVFNGQGTYYSADGGKFVGEFRDGKEHGQGTYTFADGDKFVGEFKDGVLDGYAIQYRADGSIIKEGIFKDYKFLYAQKVTPAVPVVKAPIKSDKIIPASSGSGFAVSSDGYVITNHHVIDGCEKIIVHTKENDFPVRVITYDPQNDLALLKGDFRPKTVFSLSDTRPELLHDIYVAGFPFGDKFSTSIKVTKGIVSSLTGLGNNFSNIQIDAALQSGNSGGPILDDFGNVVGVAVAKLDAKYMFDEFGTIPENTNFGIKSSVVRSVLESNNVDSPSANKLSISKSQLGKMISNGTYYISCWMTMAQIDEMKSKKVFFNNLD